MDRPSIESSSNRTVDMSVIVRGACQAYKRQRTRGAILLDVEKTHVVSPITVLLRIVLTLLQALDVRVEKPACLRVSLKQVNSFATLIVRTSATEIDLAPGLKLNREYPDHLEPIAQAVKLLEGVFEYAADPDFPAARVSIPIK